MKKYRQLLVFFLLVIAVFGFMLYKYQYERLKWTLDGFEVLDTFDSFCDKNCLVLNETTKKDIRESTLGYPEPVWRKVEDFNIYSAFAAKNGMLIKSHAYGSFGLNADFSCHIWYDYKNIVASKPGKFSYVMQKYQNFGTYEFNCEQEVPMRSKPYMLVLLHKTRKYFIPVNEPKLYGSGTAALCFYADLTALDKNSLVESVSYHKALGFTDIIVYDVGIHHGVLRSLRQMIKVSGSLRSFTTLNWNIPDPQDPVSEALIKQDCIYRTSGLVNMTAVLHWNDYLVLESGRVNKIFESRLDNVKIELDSQSCCLDAKDVKGSDPSWPMALRKTSCIFKKGAERAYVVMGPKIEKPLVNVYADKKAKISVMEECDYTKGEMPVQDTVINKLLPRLMSEKIIRLWKSGTFFNP